MKKGFIQGLMVRINDVSKVSTIFEFLLTIFVFLFGLSFFRLGLGAEFDSGSNGAIFEGVGQAKTEEKSQNIRIFGDFGTIKHLHIRFEAWVGSKNTWVEFRIKFCID